MGKIGDGDLPVPFESPRDEHGRWKKGFSGNPSGTGAGAPTKKPNLNSFLNKILEMEETVIVDGEERQVSMMEIITRQLTNAVLTGEVKFNSGKKMPMQNKDWLALVSLVFKQTAPAPQEIDLHVSKDYDEMSPEELMREYYELVTSGKNSEEDDE